MRRGGRQLRVAPARSRRPAAGGAASARIAPMAGDGEMPSSRLQRVAVQHQAHVAQVVEVADDGLGLVDAVGQHASTGSRSSAPVSSDARFGSGAAPAPPRHRRPSRADGSSRPSSASSRSGGTPCSTRPSRPRQASPSSGACCARSASSLAIRASSSTPPAAPALDRRQHAELVQQAERRGRVRPRRSAARARRAGAGRRRSRRSRASGRARQRRRRGLDASPRRAA